MKCFENACRAGLKRERRAFHDPRQGAQPVELVFEPVVAADLADENPLVRGVVMGGFGHSSWDSQASGASAFLATRAAGATCGGRKSMRSMISSSRGLVKRFEGRDIVRNAVDGISFEIPEGKLFTLLGPSGCGKTTTLRMIAGARAADGRRDRDRRESSSVGYSGTSGNALFRPIGEYVGMVFQSYAIWPHMTVYQNVAFPLTVGSHKPPKKPSSRRRRCERSTSSGWAT